MRLRSPHFQDRICAYLAALTPTQAKEAEKLDDARTAGNACGLCGAYLVVPADAAQAREETWRLASHSRSVARSLQMLGLAWLGLAWLGLAWLGLAWLGLAWLGLAWLGLAWLGLAWLGLAWLGLAWLGLAWLGLAWLGLA
jgi:hypothetical protein